MKVVSLSKNTYGVLLDRLKFMPWVEKRRQLHLQQFAEALRQYLEPYNVSGLSPEINFSIEGDCCLNNETSKALFEMVQELIDNSLRHAEAAHVCLTINCHDHRLDVMVADDGKGFDYPDQRSTGLKSVEEVAGTIGATLIIRSKKAEGTDVTLRLAV